MKKICIILILIFSISTNGVYSQKSKSEINKFLGVVGYLYDSKIRTESINGKEYEIWLKHEEHLIPKTYAETGTCFFIYTDRDQYLVTAEHVARNTSLKTDLVISSDNYLPHAFKLGDIVKEKDKLNWVYHPTADVAVILLDSSKITEDFAKCFLPFDMINFNIDAPYRESEVTVFGYPLSLGIGKRISAITKVCKPSSGLIELPRFDNKRKSDFFLLDDPSVSGFSGGLVLKLPPSMEDEALRLWKSYNKYKIVGLVHGTIRDRQGGFSAIVPSYYIKETIEMAPGFSGRQIFKYPNGNIWSERIYKNGFPWTVVSNLDINGKSQEKGSLKEGNGDLYVYDDKGNLMQIRYYVNGLIHNIEYIK